MITHAYQSSFMQQPARQSAVLIRPATEHDAPMLANLAQRVFQQTYGAAIPTLTLARYVTTALAPSAIAEQIAMATVFLVAEQDSQLLGYTRLTNTTAPTNCPQPALELAQLYIDAAAQGRGIGSRLMQAALDAAIHARYAALWLCVWEENLRARQFYQRWGMHPIGTCEVLVEAVVFEDILLMRTL
jgi:ribosomal protein S18 acetylase RimI-like enzyme